MKCPLCGAPTDVKQTRKSSGGLIWRSRLCFNDHIFRTEERAVNEPKHKDDKRRKKAPVQGG